MDQPDLISPPDTVLILGMDGSGKNHVANCATELLQHSGYVVEKRAGFFSAHPMRALTSEDKNQLALLQEKIFLFSFPLIQFLLPPLVRFLISWDLRRFQPSKYQLIVISHTPLRLLAFYLGHIYSHNHEIQISPALEKTLRRIKPVTQAKTIVLDIEHQVRRQRIAVRTRTGKADHFDAYLADAKRRDLSERIEATLVWLAQTYLDAVVLENNDLSEQELTHHLSEILK